MDIVAFLPKLYLPQRIFSGSSSTKFLTTLEAKKKAVIVSSHWYKSNKSLLPNLSKSDLFITHSGEPTQQDLTSIQMKLRTKKIEWIIAIGGGSVMDLSKLLKKHYGAKLICIPTTLGSGSEASQYAVLTEGMTKKVYAGPDLLPDVILLNPEYLRSNSQVDLGFQLCDAIAHALESLVSRASNPLTDSLSLRSLDMIFSVFEKTSKKKIELSDLETLQISALFAGCAQSTAATGLIHSFAHYLGPKLKLSHSKLIATFLIPVLVLNKKNTDKYVKLNSLKFSSAATIEKDLKKIFVKLKIKTPKLHLKEPVELASEGIRRDICTITNPFSPSQQQIAAILGKILL